MRGLACCFGMLMLTLSSMGQKPLEFTHDQMGTRFRILISGEDSVTATKAAGLAFERLDRLNEIMSDYLPDSELNRLSAQSGLGKAVEVSEDLWKVLVEAEEVSKASGGAFDVSIGALSLLWRRAFRRQEFPDSTAITQACSVTGHEAIELGFAERSVKLTMHNMRLDLGGIAKGYAVDAMGQVLRQQKIKRFLIDGGGDLLVGKGPKGKAYWEVAREDGEMLRLKKEAVATSGAKYKYLEWKGKRYSHLIDPRTGYGVSHGLTVTAKARTCTEADAWASALSILGLDGEGIPMEYLKKKRIEYWFYRIRE